MEEKQEDLSRPDTPRFNKKQQEAIDLLGDPSDTRLEYEIALEVNIADATLSRWKRLPGFMDAVNERLDASKQNVRPGIWKASYRHGEGKSVQDRRLLMEAVGDIRQKTDLTGDITVKIDWGPEKPGKK